MTSERARRSLALGVALGVHLVATLVVRSFALAPPLTPQQVSATPETLVEVSMSDERRAAPFAAPAAPSSVSGERPGGVVASRIASGRVQEVAATAAVTASREPPSAAGPPGSQDAAGAPTGAPSPGWTFRLGTPDIHPRSVDFVARNEGSALVEGPAPASTSGGVIEALDAADVERGLGRGGPVNSAVAAAARQDGPVRGNATFSVTIFSDGRVDVQVASAQTDWSRLIPAIREAVRSAKVRLPPSGRGLTVVVAVEASVRYPDGYAPPAATEVDVAAKVGPDQPTDTVAAGAPRVTLSVRGKRCQGGVTVTVGGIGAGADCSVAGIATRQVGTRIVSENRL